MSRREQFFFITVTAAIALGFLIVGFTHGSILPTPRPHAPERVVINGEVWQIVSVPFLPDAYGITIHSQHVIMLEESQDVDHERECLLHELMHAVGPEEANDAQYTSDEFIRRTTQGLRVTLRDNPQVRNFILGTD